MTYYETWNESTRDVIKRFATTDAPAGIRVVAAEDYDRLRGALTALVELIEHDAFYEADPPYDNEPAQLKDARTALQEAGDA